MASRCWPPDALRPGHPQLAILATGFAPRLAATPARAEHAQQRFWGRGDGEQIGPFGAVLTASGRHGAGADRRLPGGEGRGLGAWLRSGGEGGGRPGRPAAPPAPPAPPSAV